MSQYSVVVMHGKRGGEGRYSFEGPGDLMSKSPVRVMQNFMESVKTQDEIGYLDYEIHAALKNKELGVVTVVGEFHFDKHGNQPFMCMISAAES